MTSLAVAMAGGGTGGHIMPALAVASELQRRGHRPFFIGRQSGMEARLAPAAGFPIHWIEIGGLKRVGFSRTLKTLLQVPASVRSAARVLKEQEARVVFSTGGYVAGPVALAGLARKLPLVLLEPNVVPGFTHRHLARFATRALIHFEETAAYFPPSRSVVTGVPVREEFFHLPARDRADGYLSVLVTGGSQGSRTLNRAARESWPLIGQQRLSVRMVLQCGAAEHEALAREFVHSGLEGAVVPFIADMPAAFAQADLIVSRAGASTVAEIAAAGRPSILVPFPYAADDHQTANARVLAHAGAAVLIPDRELTGERLVGQLALFLAHPEKLDAMAHAVKQFARPDAARRAADIVEEVASR